MRFHPTQVLFAVQFTHARDLKDDRIGMFSQPLMYSDEMPSKINFTKLTVTEHHQVYDSYDEKREKPPEHDGYILTDTDGKQWANQYPTASYGQLSDEANRRFHRHVLGKEAEEALIAQLRENPGSFYECHLLTDVLEKIMKGIKDLSDMKVDDDRVEAVNQKVRLLGQLQDQIVKEFTEAYPDYRLTLGWKKLWVGAKKDWPSVTIHRVAQWHEIHQLSVEQIANEITANGKFEMEYAGKEFLCIRDTISTYRIHNENTDVRALEVLFLASMEESDKDGKPMYNVHATELFDPDAIITAAHCFLRRAASQKPYRAVNMGSNIDTIAEAASKQSVLCIKPAYLKYNFKDGEKLEVKYASGDVLTLEKRGPNGLHLLHSRNSLTSEDATHRDIDNYMFPEVPREVALFTFQQVIRAAHPESIMSLQLFQDALNWANVRYSEMHQEMTE